MLTFFIEVWLLLDSLWHGLRQDKEFRAMGILLLLVLACGAFFYHYVEGWSILDCLYFCVMTISTVGYGDFAPTQASSKAFTIVFTLLGMGLFASFVAKLVALRLDLHAKRKQKLNLKKG